MDKVGKGNQESVLGALQKLTTGQLPTIASLLPQGSPLLGPVMQRGVADVAALLGGMQTTAKTSISNASEQVIRALAQNDYQKRPVRIGSASLQARDEVGAGALGVVYHLEVQDASPATAKAAPAIFQNGVLRDDLVIKFPHKLPPELTQQMFTAMRLEHPVTALIAEIDDAAFFGKHFADAPIPGAEILYAHRDLVAPWAVKAFQPATSIGKLGRHLKGKLKDLPLERLRPDIFDKAMRVERDTGVCLDIKPKNLAWDAEGQRWVMYEYTRLPKSVEGFFTRGGFDSYVNIFNAMMATEAAKK